MSRPSQSLIARSADQFRLPVVPSSVSFDASRAAQSATIPALFAGSCTATPFEHCSVYWAGICRAAEADAPALKAVAPPAPVISNEIATTDIAATSARPVAILIARLDINSLMLLIRSFSRACLFYSFA